MKIRYYGHVGQTTGYGKAAEAMCFALLSQGAELEIRPLSAPEARTFEGANLPLARLVKTDSELDTGPDVVIVHTLPLDCAKVERMVRDAGGMTSLAKWIAYTTWEALDASAEVVEPLMPFDEVWHPSATSASAFDLASWPGREPGDIVTHVVPHAFDEGSLERRRERLTPLMASDGEFVRGLARPYRFYYVGAWNGRKNPNALVRAYAHSFTRQDNVELVLSCQGVDPKLVVQAMAMTGVDPELLPAIRFEAKRKTDEDLLALHQGADCFVTATRGEAWNLPAFDAMLAGRHVIAPENMGHGTFLERTSACLYRAWSSPAGVDVKIVDVPPGSPHRLAGGIEIQTVGAQGLTGKNLWLEPDVLSLGGAMRFAFKARLTHLAWELGGVRDDLVREDNDPTGIRAHLCARFGYHAVGKIAMGYLRQLFGET